MNSRPGRQDTPHQQAEYKYSFYSSWLQEDIPVCSYLSVSLLLIFLQMSNVEVKNICTHHHCGRLFPSEESHDEGSEGDSTHRVHSSGRVFDNTRLFTKQLLAPFANWLQNDLPLQHGYHFIPFGDWLVRVNPLYIMFLKIQQPLRVKI